MLEIWMIIVGTILSGAIIPQIWRVYKRKSSNDISLVAWLLVIFGKANWLWYSFYIGDVPLIISTFVGLILGSCMTTLAVYYRKEEG